MRGVILHFLSFLTKFYSFHYNLSFDPPEKCIAVVPNTGGLSWLHSCRLCTGYFFSSQRTHLERFRPLSLCPGALWPGDGCHRATGACLPWSFRVGTVSPLRPLHPSSPRFPLPVGLLRFSLVPCRIVHRSLRPLLLLRYI